MYIGTESTKMVQLRIQGKVGEKENRIPKVLTGVTVRPLRTRLIRQEVSRTGLDICSLVCLRSSLVKRLVKYTWLDEKMILLYLKTLKKSYINEEFNVRVRGVGERWVERYELPVTRDVLGDNVQGGLQLTLML